MADDFRGVISQLWAKLGLRPPSFAANAQVTLEVDGISLTLSESADGGHLIVAGTVGKLSADPQRRSEQVHQLLRANLGFLQSNASCLLLGSSDEVAQVRVEAAYAYRSGSIQQLKSLIEDVIHRVEIHTVDLSDDGASARRPQTSHGGFTAVSQEDFIFRP